jgi:ATP-dependent Clp protease ATP-binding subunit ClpC
VDFTNTVIVMTSNLGSEAITRRGAGIGFGAGGADADEEARREQILRPLREHFRPEFLNRIDEIVVFRQLTAEQLRQITNLLLDKTRRLLHAQGVTVEFTDPAVDWLAQRGYQPEYGARPLRRTIQREVDNRMSRLLLDGRLGEGSRVTVDVEDGQLVFLAQDEPPEPASAAAPAPAPGE